MSKTATFFLHTARGPCFFQKTLRALGYEVDVVISSSTDLSDFDPLAPDVLYVGGGGIGVYQADLFPYLQREIEIIKARIEAGKPVIGICLGAQLIAKALGAEVYKGAHGLEYGWTALELTPEAAGHPARHFCGSGTRIFHWHQDTFTLPEGAALLASSAQYAHQIIEYGTHAIGLQFHPEIHAGIMPEWEVLLVDEITGTQPRLPIERLRAETAEYMAAANEKTRLFIEEWLERAGL